MGKTNFLFLLVFVLSSCEWISTEASNCFPNPPLRGFGTTHRNEFDTEARNLPALSVFHRGLDFQAFSQTASKARENCFMPAIGLDWSASNERPWLQGSNPADFLTKLTAWIERERPPYLWIGFESDFAFEEDPLSYPQWLSFYDDLYDRVKAISPDTKVGPVFNFEHLAGLGPFVGWVTPQWEALLRHDMDRIDLIGLTVFPFFAATRPRDLPSDYLAPIFDRTDRPVAILESGWPSIHATGDSFEASQIVQAEFATTLRTWIARWDIPLAHWLYIFEPDAEDLRRDDAFSSLYLKTATGAEREAYRVWLSP